MNTNLDDNRFCGIANVVGVIDRGGDVVAAGAFDSALAGFLTKGFISLSHDWDALPIAMPDGAEERDGGLWVSGTFHSTRAAQAARAVIRERLERGLQVGLSIGFRADSADCVGFRSGAELLVYARREGLSGLDEAGIAEWRSPCRLVLRVAELFEVSVVAVPMNSGSQVSAVKSAGWAGVREELVANSARLGLTLSKRRLRAHPFLRCGEAVGRLRHHRS